MTRTIGVLLAVLVGSVAVAGEVPSSKGPRPPGATKGARAGKEEGKKRAGGPGEAFLKQGSFRAAAGAFRQEIAKNPDAVAAHVGLGKALARMGRCGEALAELWPYVGLKPFGDEPALVASMCSQRLGLVDDALYFSKMAAEMDPENTRALTTYALDLATAGDLERLDDVMGQLQVVRDDRDASLFAQAVLALRAGDISTFDEIAWFWPSDRTSQRDLSRLEAQSWLDLDNPTEVIDSVKQIRRIQRGKVSVFLRAEATRRLGYAEEAMSLLESRSVKTAEGSDVDSVKTRVYADFGRFEEARAILAAYPDDIDADLVASRWYVAWRQGDQAEVDARAAEYERVRVSPLRDLELLIPLGER